MFAELRRRWTTVMPLRARLRPYVGVAKRVALPRRRRPFLGRLRAALGA